MDDDALPNKFAALALAVAGATQPSGDDLGPSDVAALLALATLEPRTVAALAAATGLSQSAAVRMVDRLERGWLVRRRRRISREVLVDLTARGRKRAETLSRTRLDAAARILAALDAAERRVFADAVDRLVHLLAADRGFDRLHHCRFCRRESCDCGLHVAGATLS